MASHAGAFPQGLPSKEHINNVVQRIRHLQSQGATAENNAEVLKLSRYLQQFQQGYTNNVQPAAAANGQNGHAANGPPAPGYNAPPSPVTFTEEQMKTLRAQIAAFKRLSSGLPLPPALARVVQNPNTPIPDLNKLLSAQDPAARVVDAAVKLVKESAAAESDELRIEDAEGVELLAEDEGENALKPYNAYTHPFTHLKRNVGESKQAYFARLQRLLVPSVMPAGLDPQSLLAERSRFIDARIAQRVHELEELPATIQDGGLEPPIPSDDEPLSLQSTSHGKLRALIELKSLKVVSKQRALREAIAERLAHGTLLPLNRLDFRRIRRPALRDVHTTEQAERKQRVDRERRAKQKHVAQLDALAAHGREVLRVNREATDRARRLGRAVQSFHALAEKEEQKRVERLAKERLKALKADDEEAYMKLIDTAKDTRITHLLKQTDSFLDSLAHAVRAQQAEPGGPPVPMATEGASEEMFGATRSAEDAAEDRGKVDYYAVAHRIKESVYQPSILVGGTLKEYQLKGLQWMVSLYNNKLNGILADEMGLGKTIQTISLITYLIEAKRQRGPYLVIVPLSTMTNWSGEFAKWAPGVKVISYKGSPMVRKDLQNDIRMGDFQVLLTTYEYIIKDRPALCRMKWVHMIIDEGHRLKNAQSKLAQTLTTYYHSRYRLILTGTPLQNNLPELWAQLNFVLPKIFNSVKSFDEWFNTPFANSGTGDKIELNEEEALLIIRRLHKVLRPFLLRRLKKDVESELPDKVEKVVKVRMSALQAQLYKQMKKFKMIADGGASGKKNAGVKGLSNELMQLRKICQHPYLFESVEDKMNPSGMIDQSLVRTSGKLELLSRILPKFFATGHRVLIFFQMTKVMDIMEDFLKMMNWKYLRLDGGTKTEERAGHVTAFNAKDSEIMVFILSTRAGGLGLNLQTADTVIIFDSDWNPHADLQAQDRAHRIGQTKAVRILRFITEKSVEEAMYARARYKLDIDDKVIQAGRFDNKSTQEEQEEFLRSILEADQEEDNEESGDMNDDELNELIARSDEEQKIFAEMDAQRERDAAADWKAKGNRGKPPPGLMALEELPEIYRSEEPFAGQEDEIAETEGRGARKRAVVNYTDNLDDDQWAMAIEDGEDIEALAESARARRRRADASGTATPVGDGPKGRGRKKKGPLNGLGLDDVPTPSKRKRGGNGGVSMTPSIAGGDDDDEEAGGSRPSAKRRRTGTQQKGPELTPAVKEKMKKAFNEVYKALMNCTDETGRKRCELFRELPDRREYPDYYRLIVQPIALSQIRKRISSHTYKSAQHFRDDVSLMFVNARTYNQEDSWVYVDAVEMEKVFEATFARVLAANPDIPGAPGYGMQAPNGGMDDALTPMAEDEPGPSVRPGMRKSNSRRVVSDEEYLTQSDED
ncbi:unnamed protein product [Peniophora sp. CBMAI 1063]|nr:unnamed protein product [Peniophora sp. CBMAI 1063]